MVPGTHILSLSLLALFFFLPSFLLLIHQSIQTRVHPPLSSSSFSLLPCYSPTPPVSFSRLCPFHWQHSHLPTAFPCSFEAIPFYFASRVSFQWPQTQMFSLLCNSLAVYSFNIIGLLYIRQQSFIPFLILIPPCHSCFLHKTIKKKTWATIYNKPFTNKRQSTTNDSRNSMSPQG